MATKEELIAMVHELNSMMYNNQREYDKKEINYSHYKSKQLVFTFQKIDILLEMAKLDRLPESAIHKYQLNADDPDLLKAKLDQ